MNKIVETGCGFKKIPHFTKNLLNMGISIHRDIQNSGQSPSKTWNLALLQPGGVGADNDKVPFGTFRNLGS